MTREVVSKWDRQIRVRVAQADETQWFDGQLAQGHYLGAGSPVGDYLRQVVERGGRAVGLLVWGPACYALKDRDLWIGWSATMRVERLSLIAQNRRFLLLSEKGREPNLASQVLGAALRELPAQWLERFGYRVLLAETFTDPEAYAGTCYKASNWEQVGFSAGYKRVRADFYVPNESPKVLWMRALVPEARAILRSAVLPGDCLSGVRAAPSGTLPVNQLQMESLRQVLSRAPDPRRRNTHYRLAAVLTIIAMAMMAGRREISEIARFARMLTQKQRQALCLPRKPSSRAFYQIPSYSVFYQVLTRLDPEAFASLLSGWLAQQSGQLSCALAMDGKMIRDSIGLLTLADHDDGTPVSIVVIDQKEGTERCELTRAAQLIARAPALDGKIVTADPLHCQKATARHIVQKGGDYLLQIKANQPNLLEQARRLDQLEDPPFFSKTQRPTAASNHAHCAALPSSPTR